MDILETYIKQVQRYPLLEAFEEVALSKEIEKGSRCAKEKLINCNLRLVISIAKKFMNIPRVSIMDLIQEGNLGLMTAASKYNYGFKTRFSTYAYTWILQYMLRYLYNKTSPITLPHRKEELLRKIVTSKEEFKQAFNREATISELSSYCGISERDLTHALSYSYTVTSIDCETSEEGSVTLGDLIPDNKYNPEVNYLREEEKNNIKEMVAGLSDCEKKVIYGRYNFNCDEHTPTLRELSELLGVSAETVRQIEIRAVKKIKKVAVEFGT
ncbi:sigma-70 family RNA polymerase sigma factor [Treponema pectinovorum]|uniref:sigma-70 family RNA polymerase sigma factor n=1 Tax=Treponema pectinovorum TaxID=164 RepID=UPI00164E4430|nr:RNA polymerase sigma factor RpoD/SigA [Treponema pectinovorum]